MVEQTTSFAALEEENDLLLLELIKEKMTGSRLGKSQIEFAAMCELLVRIREESERNGRCLIHPYMPEPMVWFKERVVRFEKRINDWKKQKDAEKEQTVAEFQSTHEEEKCLNDRLRSELKSTQPQGVWVQLWLHPQYYQNMPAKAQTKIVMHYDKKFDPFEDGQKQHMDLQIRALMVTCIPDPAWWILHFSEREETQNERHAKVVRERILVAQKRSLLAHLKLLVPKYDHIPCGGAIGRGHEMSCDERDETERGWESVMVCSNCKLRFSQPVETQLEHLKKVVRDEASLDQPERKQLAHLKLLVPEYDHIPCGGVIGREHKMFCDERGDVMVCSNCNLRYTRQETVREVNSDQSWQ